MVFVFLTTLETLEPNNHAMVGHWDYIFCPILVFDVKISYSCSYDWICCHMIGWIIARMSRCSFQIDLYRCRQGFSILHFVHGARVVSESLLKTTGESCLARKVKVSKDWEDEDWIIGSLAPVLSLRIAVIVMRDTKSCCDAKQMGIRLQSDTIFNVMTCSIASNNVH